MQNTNATSGEVYTSPEGFDLLSQANVNGKSQWDTMVMHSWT